MPKDPKVPTKPGPWNWAQKKSFKPPTHCTWCDRELELFDVTTAWVGCPEADRKVRACPVCDQVHAFPKFKESA